MRIAHLVSSPTRHGGAETYALRLAAAQAARGDEVSLVHAADPHALAALADATNDVVHVHGRPLPPGTEPVRQGVPLVRSLHDWAFGCASRQHWFRDGSACHRAHGPGCVAGILLRGCAHRRDVREPLRRLREVGDALPTLRAGDAVVVYSEAVREAALANGLAPERVHVVPYFVDRRPEPAPSPARRTLAFVGRVVGAKGLEVALRALATVPDAWDELHVLGDGWARLDAERLAVRLGIDARVGFHGWLDPPAVEAAVAGSAALLLPSLWPEPFGIAGLEALATGRPVIASRTGGIPEWLDERCGMLVPPGDVAALATAIERLLGDPRLAAQLGAAGWEHAARFSAAAHLEQLDGVYRAAGAAAASREVAA